MAIKQYSMYIDYYLVFIFLATCVQAKKLPSLFCCHHTLFMLNTLIQKSFFAFILAVTVHRNICHIIFCSISQNAYTFFKIK